MKCICDVIGENIGLFWGKSTKKPTKTHLNLYPILVSCATNNAALPAAQPSVSMH